MVNVRAIIGGVVAIVVALMCYPIITDVISGMGLNGTALTIATFIGTIFLLGVVYTAVEVFFNKK